ncbi:MAG: WbuC family cupin fold metalloprotein [Bacteroidales bacterium]
MHLINDNLLDTVTSQAKDSKRLRMNYNLHDSLDAKAQRLLNALEVGTFLPIHRHIHTSETYILLRGKIKVMFYDKNLIDGKYKLVEETVLDPLVGNYGVHIPAKQWHTLEVLESGSVIFEVKDGPYTPLGEDDILR